MSLSRDALRRAAVFPEAYAPGETTRPRPKVTAISMRGLHLARVPWCSRHETGWQARWSDGKRMHYLGDFLTMQRARIAVRLWQYWMAQGFTPAEIPVKPEKRPYRRTPT